MNAPGVMSKSDMKLLSVPSDLASQLGGVKRIQKLGKTSFYVVGERDKAVVKTSRSPGRSRIHRCRRAILGGSVAFINERAILTCLNRSSVQCLQVPSLLATCDENLLAIQFLEGTSRAGPNRASDQEATRVGQAVRDLGTLSPLTNLPWRSRVLWSLMRAPICRAAYSTLTAVRREMGWLAVLRSFAIISKLLLRRALIERQGQWCLIHNDLHRSNFIIRPGGEVAIIDWEDGIWSRRWWMINLVDSAWDGTTATLDKRTVRGFMGALPRRPAEAVLQVQVRFALQRRLADVLTLSNTTHEARMRRRRSYQRIVLSDRGFDQWWAQHRDAFLASHPPT